MNDEIKISLTIILEGSTLVRKSEDEVFEYVITKQDLNPLKKMSKQEGLQVVKKKKYKHKPLESKPAYQTINLNKDAYNYMISSECPFWSTTKVWVAMSKKERLHAHMNRICEHFNGKSFTYVVLDD